MNVRMGLLMLLVGTASVWAQTAPATKPAPAAKTAQTQAAPAKTATPAAKPTTAAKPAQTQQKTTATATSTKKKTTKKAAAPSGAVATNVAATRHAAAPSKRDPFVSPIRANENGAPNCQTGKRCLVVDQTNLQGIVKAPNGMIAVVSNAANKAYFLRENDPIYNGYVVRITPDSVVFREQVTDKLGKKFTREVVKKVNAPAV